MSTKSEHWYEGPAAIAGVTFPVVRLGEEVDDDGRLARRSWRGTAEIDQWRAPEITPEWEPILSETTIELPDGLSGACYVASMTLTDDRWHLEIVGRGKPPMA